MASPSVASVGGFYLIGDLVPGFPVSGFTLPFVLQLSIFVLSGAVRRCPSTLVPSFFVYGRTRTVPPFSPPLAKATGGSMPQASAKITTAIAMTRRAMWHRLSPEPSVGFHSSGTALSCQGHVADAITFTATRGMFPLSLHVHNGCAGPSDGTN